MENAWERGDVVGERTDYNNLEEAFDYSFKDKSLLIQALTHRSLTETVLDSNERLEFLGDSVLQLVITDYLYREFSQLYEGKLAKTRSLLVREPTLADVARGLKLSEFLRIGKGEQRLRAQELDSLLSNVLEAIYGAIYLDGGLEAARKVILKQVPKWDPREITFVDAKSTLQEYLQLVAKKHPVYELTKETGPDHDKRFVIQVRFEDEVLGEGEGSTKKEAAQAAARQALVKLEIQEGK